MQSYFQHLKSEASPQKVARNTGELRLMGQKPLNYIKSQSTKAKGLIEKFFLLKISNIPSFELQLYKMKLMN